ncbi:MAG: class I SAM-dependent methyltransferase [Vulcanimicrobiaceae bacterium]
MSETAHPLAEQLAGSLVQRAGSRVLVAGIGSGRNLSPFLAAGIEVDALDPDPERVAALRTRYPANVRLHAHVCALERPLPVAPSADGALSTHALLHGGLGYVAAALARLAERLRNDGLLYVTFGSTRDPRCEHGERYDERTWIVASGSEVGVPHVFFDESSLRELLAAFTIDSLEERSASQTAGSWAHSEAEAQTIVHWFVRARLR